MLIRIIICLSLSYHGLFACPNILLRDDLDLAVSANEQGYRDLNPFQTEFIRKHLIPVVGKRLIHLGEGKFRSLIATPDSISFQADPEGHFYKVQWGGTELSWSQDTLFVPSLLDSNLFLRKTIMRSLTGNPLNPYIESREANKEREANHEAPRVLRAAQKEAIQVGLEHSREGKKKFMFVGPPGVGKTDVALEILEERLLRAMGQSRLLIVLADAENLATQLHNRIKSLNEKLQPGSFTLLRWGSGAPSSSISELASQVSAGKMPVVLVSTTASFRNRFVKETPGQGKNQKDVVEENGRLLRPLLDTLLYDEVHHLGARLARIIFRELVDHADAHTFGLGTTATPVGDIQKLFGSAFWAYLDNQSGKLERSTQEVLTQLYSMIDLGESTPFDQIHFIDPLSLVPRGQRPFVRSVSTQSVRYVLNPNFYQDIVMRLAPILRQRKKGFITVGTIEEATHLMRALSLGITDLNFECLHSRLHERDEVGVMRPMDLEKIRKIEKDFESGEINFLITIQKLDEGMDYPFMELWVDLNHSFTARQFIQRLGRILRLAKGKYSVDVVTLMEVSEKTVAENLELLDFLITKKQETVQESPERNGRSRSPRSVPVANTLRELTAVRDSLRQFWEKKRVSENVLAERSHRISELTTAVNEVRLGGAGAKDRFAKLSQIELRDSIEEILPKNKKSAADDILQETMVTLLDNICEKNHLTPRKFVYEMRPFARYMTEKYLHREASSELYQITNLEGIIDGRSTDASIAARDKIGELVSEIENNTHTRVLSTREREAITLYFGIRDGHCHTQKEIGNIFRGVTSARVGQILKGAIRKLQGLEHLSEPFESDESKNCEVASFTRIVDGFYLNHTKKEELYQIARQTFASDARILDESGVTYLNFEPVLGFLRLPNSVLGDIEGIAVDPSNSSRINVVRKHYTLTSNRHIKRVTYNDHWEWDSLNGRVRELKIVEVDSAVFPATKQMIERFYETRNGNWMDEEVVSENAIFVYRGLVEPLKEALLHHRVFRPDHLEEEEILNYQMEGIDSNKIAAFRTLSRMSDDELNTVQVLRRKDEWSRDPATGLVTRLEIFEDEIELPTMEKILEKPYEKLTWGSHASPYFTAFPYFTDETEVKNISGHPFKGVKGLLQYFNLPETIPDRIQFKPIDGKFHQIIVRRLQWRVGYGYTVFSDTWERNPWTGKISRIKIER